MAEKIFNKGYFRDAKESSPGQMYREIVVSHEDFEGGEKKLSKRAVPLFVQFCRKVNETFPSLGKNAKRFLPKYQDAVEFLGWDLKPEEFAGASNFAMAASVVLGLAIGAILYIFFFEMLYAFLGDIANVFVLFPTLFFVLFSVNFVQGYPLNAAKAEQTRALTFVPEILGYMIMSMKLVPNMEKAVEFSAGHGRGKIAEDFKRCIWSVQVGVFNSLAEAMDDLAYRWGKFSSELKTALMSIRASVLENTEAKRYQLLDKTMDAVLESVKDKMEQYARSVASTATTLFMLGVFLPLVLIIILPVGSAFSGTSFANPAVLFVLYNLVIPGIVFYYAWASIKQRPPTYEVPNIAEGFFGVPKKWQMKLGKGFADIRTIVAVIFIFGLLTAFFLSAEGLPPKSLIKLSGLEEVPVLLPADKTEKEVLEKAGRAENFYAINGVHEKELIASGVSQKVARDMVVLEKERFFLTSQNDITKYNFVMVLVLTISMCLFVFFYYQNVYKRKAQEQIMSMESEFKDSLYILASRMGENKPIEEALRHTREFLPNMRISQEVFGKTVENIELMGMPLEAAVFDNAYGSLKNIPSSTIRSSMKLLVDSVQLGVNVASRSMIALSLQLRNSEKVNSLLKTLTSDITSSMRLMVVFIAPVVLGITTALQKVVMGTLASIASSNISQQLSSDVSSQISSANLNVSALTTIKPDVFTSLVKPDQFLLIVSIYVIEMVIIMTYYNTKIEEDNNILVKLNIGKNLPIAMVVFIVTVVFGNLMVSGLMGNSL